jgi:regulator of nonsense transcripts 2
MRSQQQAEKEEQQRIKNLVLNYDLRDENEGSDGESQSFPLQRNFNRSRRVTNNKRKQNRREAAPKSIFATKDGQSGQPKQSPAGKEATA